MLERKSPQRDRGKDRKCYDYPVAQIRAWIAEGRTQAWIGQELGVSAKLIHKVCKKHDIKCQQPGPRSGPEHPDWKGGRVRDRHGYVLAYCPNHPRARQPRRRYVLEHILVMESHLGRSLEDGEVVHHINGRRDDNRIENLAVYPANADHLRDELAGKCPKWSVDGKRRIQAAVETLAANRKGKPASAFPRR